jgi:hypothetical protein
MTTTAILTKSFRPDFPGFTRLHETVLRFTEDDVMHHVVVPARDLRLFQNVRSPRLRVWPEADLMPPGLRSTGSLAALAAKVPVLPSAFRWSAINLRHPWPPIRGWVLQQILKLAFCAEQRVDAVIIIDSDVALVRPLATERFGTQELIRMYEKPAAITGAMERHIMWTRTAHRLLGLPAPGDGPHPDYIGGLVSWSPEVVRACLRRIEEATGRPWATAIGAEVHFSECILLGTYVRAFGAAGRNYHLDQRSLCHSYWDYVPLGEDEAPAFVEAFGPEDVAVHIQSNSGTPAATVKSIIDALTNNPGAERQGAK